MSSSLWRARRRGERPVIHGRDRERDQLRELLDDAIAGHGSLVLISGEAGIGKTTLVDDLIHEAEQRDFLVLSGGCYDLTTTPPYGPWIEAMSGYRPGGRLPQIPAWFENPEELERIGSQAHLIEEGRRFFTDVANEQPVVIVLDDLHWSDVASLDLLRRLARGLADQAILVVASYREEETIRDHPLARQLPALIREGRALRLHLRPLDQESIIGLARGHAGLSADDESRLTHYLQRLAEGNPFLTGELLYSLEEQQVLVSTEQGWSLGDLSQPVVPTLVQQAVEGRLARLDEDTRKLLDLAAVVGHEAPLDVLMELYDGSTDELDRLLQRALDVQVLQFASEKRALRFNHALTRHALYDAISPIRVQRLHQTVGELLTGRPDADPDVVGEHFYRSNDARAIEWLLRAAERAQGLYASETVVTQCDRLLDIAGRLRAPVPLDSYRLRGLARETLGNFDGARQDHETALEQARDQGDLRAEWEALLNLGMLWASRDYRRAGEYCEQAVRVARIIGDPATVGHSLNRLGNWHANGPRPTEALPYHEEALDIFTSITDVNAQGTTHDLIAMTYYLRGDSGNALHHYEQAIPLLRQSGDQQTLASALTGAAEVAGADLPRRSQGVQAIPVSLGEDHGRLLVEAIQICELIGWDAGTAYAQASLGTFLIGQGQLRAGFPSLHAGLTVAEDIGHLQWVGQNNLALGFVYLDLLLTDLAHEHLKLAYDIGARVNSANLIDAALGLLVSAQVQAGHFDVARDLLEQAVESKPSTEFSGHRLWTIAATELALAQREPERALQFVERVIESIPVTTSNDLPPTVLRLRGEALHQLHRDDEADTQLQKAYEVANRLGLTLDRWHTLVSLLSLYQTQGRADDAQEARAAVVAIIEDLSDQLDDAHLRAAFRANAYGQLSNAVQNEMDQPPPSPYADLTPREREVLRYLVRGGTDREIADELSISPRTVQVHVSRILGKLEVGSRTAAVALAIREGLE